MQFRSSSSTVRSRIKSRVVSVPLTTTKSSSRTDLLRSRVPCSRHELGLKGMGQYVPRSGWASKKLHPRAAAEKQQSITLVNPSFDERKIVVCRSKWIGVHSVLDTLFELCYDNVDSSAQEFPLNPTRAIRFGIHNPSSLNHFWKTVPRFILGT